MHARFLDDVFGVSGLPLSETWTRPRNLLAFYAPLLGAGVAVFGLLVILAWTLNFSWLISLGFRSSPMQPQTALAFVLAGSGFALNTKFLPPFKFRRLQFILAGPVLLICFLSLLENFYGADFGLAHLFPVADALVPLNGPMANLTALTLLMLGAAQLLLLTYRRVPTTIAGGIAAAVLLISIFALAGYGLRGQDLQRIHSVQAISLHSAICFFLFSLGTIGLVVAANWRSYGKVDVRIARFGLALWLIASIIELFSAQFVLRISNADNVVLFALLVFKFLIMVVLFAAVVSAGVVLMSISSQEQETLKARLVENERMFRTTFQNARQGIQVLRADGTRVDVNLRACEIFGRSRDELLGHTIWESTKLSDVADGQTHLARLAAGEIASYEREKRIVRGDGEERWVKVIATTGAVAKDDEKTFVVVIDDIQKAKDAEQARDLLMGEMNHRVKNTLAVIQGMIGKLKNSNVTAEDMATSLLSRITNLGASYDLLNRKDWNEPSLLEIYDEALRVGFDHCRDRIDSSLENTKVDSQAAVYLGMIFHELMTNSTKYGAFSNSKGRVKLVSSTEVRDDGKIWVTASWTESDGPPVSPPTSEGFGSFVLQRGVSFGLRGVCDVDYAKDGLHVTWSFPASLAD